MDRKYILFWEISGNGLKKKLLARQWTEIDKISKEDLMFLLNKAVSEEFEMDEYLEENIGHKAHQIVYKSIHEKFSELVENKNVFKDECDSMFKSAIKKYKVEEENEEE